MHSAAVGYGWIVPASCPMDTLFWAGKMRKEGESIQGTLSVRVLLYEK